jgi:hypothetical protein
MKHILRYAPIAAALLLITSCASKKAITDGTQLPTQTSKTDKNAEKEAARQSLQFVQRIANNNVATENILTSGDFTLQLGSKEITVPAKLSMRKDECIRIQLLMPILRSELARIEFTPNYVLLLDRYHKEYIKASYSEVSFLANNGLSFYSLQALFWNQLIAPGAKTITEADLKKFVADVAAGSSRVPVTLKAGNITYKWSVDAATALIKGADITYKSAAHGTSSLSSARCSCLPLSSITFFCPRTCCSCFCFSFTCSCLAFTISPCAFCHEAYSRTKRRRRYISVKLFAEKMNMRRSCMVCFRDM